MRHRTYWLVVLLVSRTASASEFTELASSGDSDDPFDFNLSVGYDRTQRKAAIKRELTGSIESSPGTKQKLARPLVVKDLEYSQVVHTLPIRAEIGVWKDLQIHVVAPLIISNTRTLEFARAGDDPCTFAGEQSQGDLPTCVDARNSTVVRDGLLPGIDENTTDFQGMAGERVVASKNVAAGGPGLKLPKRSGFDQLHVGMDYALLSQARDDTKPTWVLGFEARIAVGSVMDYDPERPDDNTSVGQGVHELVWQTSFSKAQRFTEPFLRIWYALPLATEKSLFKKYGSGQDNTGPQHHAGVDFGLEVFALNRPEVHQKIGIELGGHISGAFEGRGYSEMWEVFRRNPVLTGPCGINADSPDDGIQADEQWAHCDRAPDAPDDDGELQHPGITDIENYASFGGNVAIRTEIGQYVKFRIGVSLLHDLAHLITLADAGIDGLDDDQVVTPDNANEINPVYRPLIDQIGRRFRVEETTVFDFFASATVLF